MIVALKRSIAAESFKLWSVPGPKILLASALVLSLLVAILGGVTLSAQPSTEGAPGPSTQQSGQAFPSPQVSEPSTGNLPSGLVENASVKPKPEQKIEPKFMVAGAVSIGMLLLWIFGMLSVTTENRFNTVRMTALAIPDRWISIVGKSVVTMAIGAAVMAVIVPLAYLMGPLFTSRSLDWSNAETWGFVWRLPIQTALGMLAFIGLGLLLRQSAGALVAALVWLLLVEKFVVLIPNYGHKIAPYMPFSNGDYWSVGSTDINFSWSPIAGLAYFAAFCVALLITGILVSSRRDI